MSVLARNKHDAQPPADGPANHLQCADAFAGHPLTADEIQYRASRIQLDDGGLFGYELDDWFHGERELTEAQHFRAVPARNLVPPRAQGHTNFLRRTYESGATCSRLPSCATG
jgi:hypothetical protein